MRQKLLDDIEEIQTHAEDNNPGLNEERLEVREMIVDYIIKLVNDKPEENN